QGILLVSADPSAAGEALRASAAATIPVERAAPLPVRIIRDKTLPVYRATFLDNIRVFQSDQPLATANVMHVDFMMGDDSGAATQPATVPAEPAAPIQSKSIPKRPKNPAKPSPARRASAAPVR